MSDSPLTDGIEEGGVPRSPTAQRAAGRAVQDFKDLRKEIGNEHRERFLTYVFGFLVGLVPVGWVGWSRPLVLVYAAVVVAAAVGLGFVPLKRLLSRMLAEAAALEEVARRLAARLDTQDLLHLLDKHQEPRLDAHQHVMLALEREQSAGGALPSFVAVETELDQVSFARNALVLMGLFGTVLFFTVSLVGHQLTPATLGPFLADVRAALACTLTGIAASLALGVAGGRAASLHEALVQRTRELLGGPVAAAAATSTAPGNVWTEPQLWAKMLAHFKAFADDAAATHQKLGDDIAAHGTALQDLAQKLAAAQAFTIPEGVAQFAPAAERFEQGVTLLHSAVERLVTLVGNVNVKTPVATLERLGGIEARQAGMEERTLTAVGAAHEEVQTAGKILEEVRSEVQALAGRQAQAESKLETRLQEVQELATSMAAAATAAEMATREILLAHTIDPRPLTEALTGVANGQAGTERSLGVLQGQVRELGARIEPLAREVTGVAESHAVLQEAAGTLRTEAGGLQHSVSELGALSADIRSAGSEVTSGAATLRHTADELRTQARQSAMEQESTLRLLQAKMTQGFRQLEPLVEWHRRKMSGPLTRLSGLPLSLLHPLRRRRRPAVRTENARPSRRLAFWRRGPRAAPEAPDRSPAEPARNGAAAGRPERRSWFPFRWRKKSSAPAYDAAPGRVFDAGAILPRPAETAADEAPPVPAPWDDPAPPSAQPDADGATMDGEHGAAGQVPAVQVADEASEIAPEPFPEPSREGIGQDSEGNTSRATLAAPVDSPFTTPAVHEFYARWVRDAMQPSVPPEWDVVPTRLVRMSQEHAAAVPVPLFEDAGQVADFVRFSPAGGTEGLVLPHPDAAHDRDVLALLFPGIAASGPYGPDDLPQLPPLAIRRDGAYWAGG